MIKKYGFIFLSPNADPSEHRTVIETRGLASILVAVPEPSVAVSVAKALVADGVDLIELCGAFGPIWASKVIEATEGTVPVGAVGFGPESVPRLAALLRDP